MVVVRPIWNCAVWFNIYLHICNVVAVIFFDNFFFHFSELNSTKTSDSNFLSPKQLAITTSAPIFLARFTISSRSAFKSLKGVTFCQKSFAPSAITTISGEFSITSFSNLFLPPAKLSPLIPLLIMSLFSKEVAK